MATLPVLSLLGYGLLSLSLTRAMWATPSERSLAENPHDEVLLEWFLARTAHAVGQLDFSLITPLMNAPRGVNLMANASIIAPGVAVAPITMLFGPAVSFVLLLTLGPALTAWTTCLVLRRFVYNPGAAVVGGLVFGFCPAMIAQSLAHLHMTLAFLVPLILLQVYELVTSSGSPIPPALRLAGLTVVQIFIGEEWLFIAAILATAALVCAAACRPREVPRVAGRLLKGGGLAVGVVLVVVGYPLWIQFAGPGSVVGSPFLFDAFSMDLKSYVLPSSLQRFGSAADKARSLSLRGGRTEQNAAMGWPFLVVVGAAVVALRRRLLVRVAAGAALILAVLSLGPALLVENKATGVGLPWGLVAHRRVFESALPTRFAFAIYLLIALILALAVDHVTRHPPAVSVAPLTAILVSLLLISPLPLAAVEETPVPSYFEEAVRRDVPEDSTVLVVPVPTPQNVEPMRWQMAAGLRFRMVGGFYLGPGPDRRAFFTPVNRNTQSTLIKIHQGDPYPPLDPATRADAAADIGYWNPSHVILGPSPKQAELLAYLTGVIGRPPRESGGVLVWALR
ncbi:MAG TPA: hypothetical protein VNB94_11980 [Mycobacteriales bacterium]|nr:hypothetical protein [Mycobacteriales bacterium]